MILADWLSVFAILVCLVLSAFFAGSETALTASSRARMHRMEKHGNPRSGVVNRLLRTRETRKHQALTLTSRERHVRSLS